MFKLFRPNQVRLTDVTYIDYGGRQRAYGSAIFDPVTGKLIAFVVQSSNDQKLADDTLSEMDNFPCEFGGKFHSDQGALYLSPKFKAQLKERGFELSMSRKGNCWDNAPMESFFGHFKDECDYSQCKTLDELREMIDEYKYYYNYERTYNYDTLVKNGEHMTPVKYEAYLNSLSEEEFQDYLRTERARYEAVREHSIERAKERARDLGAFDTFETEEIKPEDITTEETVGKEVVDEAKTGAKKEAADNVSIGSIEATEDTAGAIEGAIENIESTEDAESEIIENETNGDEANA